jgi:hypothetical protein
MPFHPDEPYRVHMAPHHPQIYEQGGHFFYPDGSEIPLEVAKRLLDYNPELCKRWGIPVNYAKWAWMEEVEAWDDKRIKDRLQHRFFDAKILSGNE